MYRRLRSTERPGLSCPVLKTRDPRIWASFAPSFDIEGRTDWNYWVQLHRHTGCNEVCCLGVGMARWVDGAMSGTLDARPERTISCIYNCKVPGMMCSGSVQCRRRGGLRYGESVRRSSLWATGCSPTATSRKTAAREGRHKTQARSPPAQGRLHRGSQLQEPAPRALARPGGHGPCPMSSSLRRRQWEDLSCISDGRR